MERLLAAILFLVLTLCGCVACSNTPTFSTEGMSPAEVVQTHLETNDVETFLLTMTEEVRDAISNTEDFNSDLNYGVISFKVLDIYEVTVDDEPDLDERKERILESEWAEGLSLTADNICFVYVKTYGEYDTTKIPVESGDHENVFLLVRNQQNSSWLIQDWGLSLLSHH